jgi:nicotianamine synthase
MNSNLISLKTEMESLGSLKPDEKVNKLFSHLVSCATSFTEKDLSYKNFFQEKAAFAEVEMEKFWAEKIITSADPKETLLSFWYYKNYLDLTKLEYGSLSLCHDHKKHKNILFVGSGPLPLTAFFLAKEFGCKVSVMDNNKESLEMSKKLFKKLGISDAEFIFADAFTFRDYNKFETIFVAAMIESDKQSKEDFINMLGAVVKEHTHILVRSVFHNRELLYKKFDVTKVFSLKSVLEVRPKNEIVNSFHVFEK